MKIIAYTKKVYNDYKSNKSNYISLRLTHLFKELKLNSLKS